MPVIYENHGHRKRAMADYFRFAWKVSEWRKDPHCRSCGRETILMGMPGFSYKVVATVDHIISRYNGGSDTIDNFQMLCGRCNTKKSRTEQPVQQRKGEPA